MADHTVTRTRTAEEWRAVPAYEGLYEVSNLGRVRSVNRVVVRSDGLRVPLKGRIISASPRSGGYLALVLHNHPRQPVAFRVHNLVAAAFIGPRPEGAVIRHLNGDPSDNRPENLAYGNQSENMIDSVDHGTNRNSQLTHCPQGHPYDEANTRWSRRGDTGRPFRMCKTCQNSYGAKRKRAKRKLLAEYRAKVGRS